jgi:hypothetical protein
VTCLEGGGVPALCWRLLPLPESREAPKVTCSLSEDVAPGKTAGQGRQRVGLTRWVAPLEEARDRPAGPLAEPYAVPSAVTFADRVARLSLGVVSTAARGLADFGERGGRPCQLGLTGGGCVLERRRRQEPLGVLERAAASDRGRAAGRPPLRRISASIERSSATCSFEQLVTPSGVAFWSAAWPLRPACSRRSPASAPATNDLRVTGGGC